MLNHSTCIDIIGSFKTEMCLSFYYRVIRLYFTAYYNVMHWLRDKQFFIEFTVCLSLTFLITLR
jgi:hypothetical protein